MRVDSSKTRAWAVGGLSTILLAWSIACAWAQSRVDQEMTFDLPAQSLATALVNFSRQANVQVLTSSPELGSRTTVAIRGRMSVRRALERLLRNSALTFSLVGDDTVVVHRPGDTTLSVRPVDASGSASRPDAAAVASRASRSDVRPVPSLEEIIVTARKREESLQAAPLAVTAFSGGALQLRNVDSIDRVAQFVPNLQFDGAAALSGGSFNTTLFIRGIGQNDFATFTDPGVGLYVDGVYLGRTIGAALLAFDLGRIEVLRGPQGSVFGRNTIGGAINIVSEQPSAEATMDFAVTAGSLQRRDLKAVINLPLAGGTVLNRWSLAATDRKGYARQINYLSGAVQERGDQNALLGRWQTQWQASEHTELNLKLDATRTRQHAAPLTLVRVTPPGNPYLSTFNAQVAPQYSFTAPDGGIGVNSSWITGDPYITYGDYGNYNHLDDWGASLAFDSRISTADFKSITAYRQLRADFARDGDNSPYAYRETFNKDEQWQFSQEMQLAGLTANRRINWLAGLYYFNEHTRDRGAARLATGVYEVTGNPLQDLDIELYNVNTSTSYAAFAQVTYRISPRWSVTPGVRFTHDRKTFSGYQYRLRARQYLIPPGFYRSAAWNQFSPKLSVEWQTHDEALLYASIANGYKSGGFNARPLRSVDEVREYAPETVWSYELGAKTRWFERRIVWNSALFYNDYQDIQLTVNATPRNFLANAAAGRILGAESELTARVAADFDINASAGYLHARYSRLSPCSDFGGGGLCLPINLHSRFVKAPEWTLSAGAQYGFNIGNGKLTVRGDWSHKSFTYHDVGNDPAIAQPGYALVNAHARYATYNERFQLSLFTTNLTDRRYRVSGNASSIELGSLAESTFGPPREWGATLSYGF